MSDIYDRITLDGEWTFPLYACAKEITRAYKPYLDAVGLTYTQYLVMTLLWEHGHIHTKTIGERLYLDSGTLTPVLKALEKKGYLQRTRDEKDSRNLIASITKEGLFLKDDALAASEQLNHHLPLTPQEHHDLAAILGKILGMLEG
ncbi:MAG: MarR family transcriptional regulator [Peptococcaceae bacterium]|nr:MarR family transcriptional regulator [Peptococcaceae bacterium]